MLREDTYSIVKEKTKEGSSYCSLCSRLRRGILYTAAEDLGCNRLALGHHRDDALETLLMNMCHQGQTKALPARYIASRGIEVIRPLIYAGEDDIASFASSRGFPILPCNLCGSQPDGTPGQRKQMKLLLAALDGVGDGTARVNMLNALSSIRPTHLLDRELREACGLDGNSGALLYERGRKVSHGDPKEVAREEEVVVLKAAAMEAEETTGGTQRRTDGSMADARRSRFRPTIGPPIVCAPSASAYEAGIQQLVQSGDTVMEIGCQLGRTTRLITSMEPTHVLGLDIERELNGKSGRSSSSQYRTHANAEEAGFDKDQVELALIDPWETLAVLDAIGDRSIDVLLIDVNPLVGNDLPLTALSLARQLSRCLPSVRNILIKSRSLSKLERQLILPSAYKNEGSSAMRIPTGWLPRVIPAVGVKEYRAAATAWLEQNPGKSVLEVGCHLGTSTALLHDIASRSGGFAMGVDLSKSIIQRAKALHPEVTFEVSDAWDGNRLKRAWEAAYGSSSPSLICLDVGGVSSDKGELDSLALLRMLTSTFGEGLEGIVVKSHCLRSTARTLQAVGWGEKRRRVEGGGATVMAAPTEGRWTILLLLLRARPLLQTIYPAASLSHASGFVLPSLDAILVYQ